MTNESQEAKRRFDDVYRALLVIGPILSFSFSNYSISQNMINFVYYAGFPALITAVLLSAIGTLLNKLWEYCAKFIGYDCIWFACSILFIIVYMKGDPIYSAWYWLGIVVTVIIAYLTGDILVKGNVISRNYAIAMTILPVALGLIAVMVV